MGCGGSASRGKPDEDLMLQYKNNYDPKHDDVDGLPLSSLIACPVVAAMYNSGCFTTLAPLVEAAKAETFAGWDASPAHVALYESQVESEDVEAALVKINCTADVARTVVKAIPKNPTLFQCHNGKYRHGQSSHIRYDAETHTGGYSKARFDNWWKFGNHMSDTEMKNMLADLEQDSEKVLKHFQWVKKYSVFVLVFYAWGGDSKLGVDVSVYESLYCGRFPDGRPWVPHGIGMGKVAKEVLKAFLGL